MLSENLLTSIGGYDIFMIALDEANVISASPLIPTIEFDIYPNPAADHITIATENEITCVSLFDMNGRKLRHWGQEGLHEKEISLADLLPGMYFIQVAAEDVQLAKKIIVE